MVKKVGQEQRFLENQIGVDKNEILFAFAMLEG
jgi:hypothetical protein